MRVRVEILDDADVRMDPLVLVGLGRLLRSMRRALRVLRKK